MNYIQKVFTKPGLENGSTLRLTTTSTISILPAITDCTFYSGIGCWEPFEAITMSVLKTPQPGLNKNITTLIL